MTQPPGENSPLFRIVFHFDPAKKEIVLGAIFSAEVFTVQEAELEKEDLGDTLLCYFETLEEAETLERRVREFIAELQEPIAVEYSIEPLESLDWINEWKKYVPPVRFGETLIVCPQDETIQAAPGQHVVRIDPQLAFGTGAHETTRLMLSALVKQFEKNNIESLLDVGCGSGILSIVAKKFGVQRVVGLDNKQRAYDVSVANAKVNDVDILFSTQDLSEHDGQYQIVVANIISSVIISLWQDLKRCVEPGGLLLISGILAEEKTEFLEKIATEPIECEQDGEWIAFHFQC